MAHGLEVRAPLLDHAFIEWAYQINSQDNIRHNEGKYAFKKSLERYVSNDILYRPKMGFGMPIAHWFRTSLQSSLYDNVLSDAMCDSGFFNVDQLKKMIHDHQQGYRDHGVQLWCLLMFSQFMVRQ